MTWRSSIRERGVIQPVVVRPVRGVKDSFEIIAGERRWRAAQRAGLHEVPIVPVEATDSEALELAIIENVQRTDLNPLEEAAGYQALASEYQHSHDAIARIVGKSRSHITNTLRLLKLPEPVKAYITAGKITAGAARMLVGASDPEQMAREIVERGLNVRQVEALRKIARAGSGKAGQRARRTRMPIRSRSKSGCPIALGLAITIDHRGTGGVLQVHYRSSISSTKCCGGWNGIDRERSDCRKGGAGVVAYPHSAGAPCGLRSLLRVHRERKQRAPGDDFGERGLPACFQRRVGELGHGPFESR